MQICRSIDSLRDQLADWRQASKTLALVPTMGNLHAGHLKLIEEAQKTADKVIVSIFVNPTQFGPTEDFSRYPRTEADDIAALKAQNTDLLFLPSTDEIYPAGEQTRITVDRLSALHCGAFRPGHFSGVATIVCKLFNLVQPDLAVFGLKDYQQLAVIRTLVRDLNLAVTLVGVDTVRETSGLAMSSRNRYLTPEEHQIAPKLYEVLCQTRCAIDAGEKNFRSLETQALLKLRSLEFIPDYFNICRSNDLELADFSDKNLVILTAAKLGNTRLIDNIYFASSW